MTDEPMTPGKLVNIYLTLRDKKREMEERHKQELKPFNEALAQIEAVLAKTMEDTGLENLKTDQGTAYKSTKSSVTVADWDIFLNYVRTNDAWHLLEHRVSKTAAQEILDETDRLPPGLNMTQVQVVNVRKN